jgi:hypothetical protein
MNKYKCDINPDIEVKERCKPSAEGTDLETCLQTCLTPFEKKIKTRLQTAIETTKKKRELQMAEVREHKIRDVDQLLGDDLLNEARGIIHQDFDVYQGFAGDNIMNFIVRCDNMALLGISEFLPNLCVLHPFNIAITGENITFDYSLLKIAYYIQDKKTKSDQLPISQAQIYNTYLETSTDAESFIPMLEKAIDDYDKTKNKPMLYQTLFRIRRLSMMSKIMECVEKGQNVVIPLSINQIDAGSGHANILLIRIMDNKQIIRIEPYGYNAPYKQNISNFMYHVFLQLKASGFVYVDSVLDVLGPQAYEFTKQCSYVPKKYKAESYFPASGLCQTWSIYISLVFLLNVNVPATVIGNYLSFRDEKDLLKRTNLFEKKALATFLLLSWVLIENAGKHQIGLPEHDNCFAEGFLVFKKYQKYFEKLGPVYDKIDEIMKGLKVGGGGGYYRKYVKYKLKYLRLKKLMGFAGSL